MAGILYVDVEWNQVGNVLNVELDEIVQIGAICTLQERHFFKIVRPQNMDLINTFTLKTMNLSALTLQAAKPLDIVMENFISHFPEFDVIVVWNRDAYDILVHNVKGLGYKLPKHRVVILQEVISDIAWVYGSRTSMVNAMRVAGIEFDKNWLHCAKHDVRYLMQMYDILYERYKEKCVEDHHEMCYINLATGMLHLAGCTHIMSASEQNRLVTHRWKVFYGAKVCQCCNRNDGFRKLQWKAEKKSKLQVEPKSLPKKNVPVAKIATKANKTRTKSENLTDEYISSVCQHYGVMYNVGAGVIFVRTNVATWRIYHDGRRVTSVYHENYRYDKDQHVRKHKLNEGFHKQDVKYKRLDEVVRYIESHDRCYLERGLKRKSRLEKLFEMVEMG